MEFLIRQELPADYITTETIVKNAFEKEEFSDHKEHLLVKRIRQSDAFIPELSLVAVNDDQQIIGHILLSKIKIVDQSKSVQSLALAPVSVAPDYQHKGIGGKLIRAALKKAKELNYASVICLGHQDYYPKFGFRQAQLWNIKAPFEVPTEVFMALELQDGALDNVQGVVEYSEAFSE